jgi:hypothetical protein
MIFTRSSTPLCCGQESHQYIIEGVIDKSLIDDLVASSGIEQKNFTVCSILYVHFADFNLMGSFGGRILTCKRINKTFDMSKIDDILRGI